MSSTIAEFNKFVRENGPFPFKTSADQARRIISLLYELLEKDDQC